MEVLCIKCGKVFNIDESQEELMFHGIPFPCENCMDENGMPDEQRYIQLFLDEKIIFKFKNKEQWANFFRKYSGKICWRGDKQDVEYLGSLNCIAYYKNEGCIYRAGSYTYESDDTKRFIIEYGW